MAGEVSTADIIHNLFATGKNCFVPRWDGSEMEMVKLSSLEDYKSLPMNKWNIPGPSHDEARENALDGDGLDLIIVPGLAFDSQGWRMGHGKGYYDRYLQRLAAHAQQRGQKPPTSGK
ncbi:hypothetical protein HK104_003409 [Borealophlyctis nickersoniae]|nr:hypothetical protein HK104_003409 [Borealophlyctis nickersoniae]